MPMPQSARNMVKILPCGLLLRSTISPKPIVVMVVNVMYRQSISVELPCEMMRYPKVPASSTDMRAKPAQINLREICERVKMLLAIIEYVC